MQIFSSNVVFNIDKWIKWKILIFIVCTKEKIVISLFCISSFPIFPTQHLLNISRYSFVSIIPFKLETKYNQLFCEVVVLLSELFVFYFWKKISFHFVFIEEELFFTEFSLLWFILCKSYLHKASHWKSPRSTVYYTFSN